jgi:ABC-2 type transport system permease protein
MFERIKHMLIKEFIQILRDPKLKIVIFVIPTLQVLAFGYAVNLDVKNISTAVYDLDHTQASRELIARFMESGYFEIKEYVNNESRGRDLIDQGKAQVMLRLDKGFEQDLLAGKSAHAQIIVDGTDSNTASVALNYSTKIASQFSQQILIARTSRLTGSPLEAGQIDMQTRAWFNDNLESRNFYVPGVIAVIIMIVTLILTSAAVVREKEIGTIEQIMVTPITPVEFILGKTVPFALIGFIDVIVIALVGVLWFKVPIRGNLLILLVATGLYLLTTLGVGLFISTISSTQQQAMMSTFFFNFPSMLLSGFVFPVASMPVVIRWLTYLNPLRYYIVVIRGIFLKGVGINILWPYMAALAVIGIIVMTMASLRFHKTLS